MSEIIDKYRNYLHSIEYNREYGELYGDTSALLRMYEKQLEEYHIRVMTKQGVCEKEKVKVKEYK